ncbi:MAG: NAD(P)/FAD-dependent oxidoreductase [Candidatus Moranbacteria bacterium]|nr:NAD(P)/FAD-dependent oxidoreductase [Candidatus Moranbacteria bacterium]
MAAGKAGEAGARVLLVEKNDRLGRKLLLTGEGRCNITHAEFDNNELVKSLGKKGKFLFSSLNAFNPENVMEFFSDLGVATKIEKGGKVFPVSDNALDVLQALEKNLKKNAVEVMTCANVLGFETEEANNEKKIKGVQLIDRIIYADKFILATGGKSYPATGSTGDGYVWARAFGHKIIIPQPSLVPLKIEEDWAKELQGVSLKNVKISLMQDDESVVCVSRGDLIFTHFGVSGPVILNLSRTLAELEKKDDQFFLSIDLKPEIDRRELDASIQKDFARNINKDIANYLPELVPQKMAKIILRLAEISGEKKINTITKKDRLRMINLLKDMRLTVIGNTGFAQAMVTKGGVNLKEVNPKNMQSKIVPNLFLTGEVLDLDGPTGGYNLQIAWSTGYVAGIGCVNS